MGESIKRTIRVLKEDTTDAERMEPQSCMVAQAANRDLDFLEKGWYAEVDGYAIDILDEHGVTRYTANLKQADRDRIEKFDEGKVVEPFTINATFKPYLDPNEADRDAAYDDSDYDDPFGSL